MCDRDADFYAGRHLWFGQSDVPARTQRNRRPYHFGQYLSLVVASRLDVISKFRWTA